MQIFLKDFAKGEGKAALTTIFRTCDVNWKNWVEKFNSLCYYIAVLYSLAHSLTKHALHLSSLKIVVRTQFSTKGSNTTLCTGSYNSSILFKVEFFTIILHALQNLGIY